MNERNGKTFEGDTDWAEVIVGESHDCGDSYEYIQKKGRERKKKKKKRNVCWVKFQLEK